MRSRVHGADQGLVGEGQQILDRPAASSHHDDVDVGHPVEPLERLDHLQGRARSLHGRVHHLEVDRGPAPSGVVEHVALRRGPRAGDQPDAAGQERQGPFELGGEEALGGQQLTASLEPGQQLAQPDHPDLAGHQRQGAAVGVEGGLGVQDDAGALDQRRVQAVEEHRVRR